MSAGRPSPIKLMCTRAPSLQWHPANATNAYVKHCQLCPLHTPQLRHRRTSPMDQLMPRASSGRACAAKAAVMLSPIAMVMPTCCERVRDTVVESRNQCTTVQLRQSGLSRGRDADC